MSVKSETQVRREILQKIKNLNMITFRTIYMNQKIWFVLALYVDKNKHKVAFLRFVRDNEDWKIIQRFNINYDNSIDYVMRALEDFKYSIPSKEDEIKKEKTLESYVRGE